MTPTPDDAVLALPLDSVLEDLAFGVRIFLGDIDRLAVRLLTEGQREPITVRSAGERHFVVDGHRRRRAFARLQHLRLVTEAGRHLVYEGARFLRESPRAALAGFDPTRIRCRLAPPGSSDDELYASQLRQGGGKPFTLLERMLLLSRLARPGRAGIDELASWTGATRAMITIARSLNPADPRLLDCVRIGRLPERLALRLLATHPPAAQVDRLQAAMRIAERRHRHRLFPCDFDREAGGGFPPGEKVDRVRARLCDLAAQMEDAARFAGNPVAADRLGTLSLLHQYVVGKVGYARIEAHLLGRD